MKYRIAMWASAGLLVVCGWQFYIHAIAPAQIAADPTAWALALLSCPIIALGFYLGFGVQIGWVLVANAFTYALIGLLVETIGRRIRHVLQFTAAH